MKKLIPVIIVLVVLTSSLAFAGESNSKYLSDDKTEYSETVRVISNEEAIKILMEKKDFTYLEAYNAVCGVGLKSLRNQSTVERIKTYSYPSGENVEIGALYRIYQSGSFAQISSCIQVWTGASGSGSYDWNEFYVSDTTSSYPTTKASARGRGVIIISIDTSTSVGASIGSELLGANFEITGTVGSTTKFRKTQSLSLDYSI